VQRERPMCAMLSVNQPPGTWARGDGRVANHAFGIVGPSLMWIHTPVYVNHKSNNTRENQHLK